MTQGRHRAGGPQKRPQRVTETSDYVAAMTRMMIAWGDRVAHDPAALVHLRELESTLSQQTSRGIWEANERAAYSQNQIAACLGVTRQAIQQRIAKGRLAAAALVAARGGGALVPIGEVRARRARLLAAANVPDLTGSDRERQLRAV